jgi:hypothetical protein
MTANLMAQVPNYVPTNGLVGWWPFNGNANDESGNGNNGTVNGATLTTDRFGNANKAYSFDGVNDWILTNYSGILGSGSRSVSFWAKQSLQNSTANNQIVLGWGSNVCGPNGIAKGFYCAFNIGANGISLDANESGVTFDTPNPVSDNNWHHYVYVKESNSTTTGQIKIYQDGILMTQVVNSYISNGTINTTSETNLTFGKKTFTCVPDRFFTGFSDDIGIWNRAITSQEISDLYNAINCANDLTISPSINFIQTGNTANFTATTSDANATFTWQSDFGQGFQTLNNVGNYAGATTNTLSISNVQLANHNQPIRAISATSNCTDTSNVATIQIADTCITTVYDTLYTTVTDTLIINTTLSLPAPNNENTILIYPNPASDHITIDNGNFAAMAGYSIKIENNAGQQVFQSLINQAQFYVDLSTWTGNGLYFVHLIDPQNNTVTVRKIVLQ